MRLSRNLCLALIFIFTIGLTEYSTAIELIKHGKEEMLECISDCGPKEVTFNPGVIIYKAGHSSLFVHKDGLLTFSNTQDLNWAKDNPFADKENGLIAPFWIETNITLGGEVYYTQTDKKIFLDELSSYVTQYSVEDMDFEATWAFLITWEDMTTYSGEKNSFQVILLADSYRTFALFLYEKLEWFDLNGNYARAGFSGENSDERYLEILPYSGNEKVSELNITSNVGEPGLWIYRVSDDNIVDLQCSPDELTFYPPYGVQFGGEALFIGACVEPSDNIKCKFGVSQPITVDGYVVGNNKVVCITPPLFESGEVNVTLSLNGGKTYEAGSGLFTIVEIGRSYSILSISKVLRTNSGKDWDTAGNPLNIRWDSGYFDSDKVDVSVMAYQEDDSWGPRWEEVYKINSMTENDGELTFTPRAVEGLSMGQDFGAIRVMEINQGYGKSVWSDVHSFGYILEDEYQAEPEKWSSEKCSTWADREDGLADFIADLLPCPCTLDQAISDFGRFQPDEGCSLYLGSICSYHEGAKHCVRSVVPVSDGGNQCCYNEDGNLLYSQDTDGGSTPDRSHTWGARPYNGPGKVPTLSHWKDDVISFSYCCQWSDNCWKYMDRRRTKDCYDYETNKPAAIFGDPHFYTLDEWPFTFNGKGEYTLLKANTPDLFEIQGRFEIINVGGEDIDATVLTAIAVISQSNQVTVKLSETTVLEVYEHDELIEFGAQTWLDFSGFSMSIPIHIQRNVVKQLTFMFEQGIGLQINTTVDKTALMLSVVLPPTMKGKVEGLLGNGNDDESDDFTTPDNLKYDKDSSPEKIYEYGKTWLVKDSFFHYTNGLDKEFYANNNGFIPKFEAPDVDDAFEKSANELCTEIEQCIFDAKLTLNLTIADSTKTSVKSYQFLQMASKKVITCPYIKTPLNGEKKFVNGINHLPGSIVSFSCDAGFTLVGSPRRECQESGIWSGYDIENFCLETECESIEIPAHGSLNVSTDIWDHTVLTIICDDGYKRGGAPSRACINSQWSGLPFLCYQGVSPDVRNRLIYGSSSSLGVVLTIILAFTLHKFSTKKEKD